MKKLLIGLGVLAAVVVIVIAAVSRRKVSGEGVYAEKVSRGDVVTEITGTGVIQPRTKVNISSEVYGQIIALPVKEGQTVAKGDLLVRIDPEKYRSEVDRLAANVRVSRTAIESEEANLRNLEIEKRRAGELFAQEVLSSSEKEKADLAVETSLIRLKSLKESVAQAEASLSRAKDDLGKTTIYAPMAGKITQVATEVGEQVIVGTTNIPGSVLMVISDMSEILAEVNVDETEIVKLQPGQNARVTADAVEKTTYEGRVTEIGNTARKQGEVNVFNVKVLLTSPDERLRPGMTAKAKIEVERRANVLRVPVQAVTARERKKLEEEKKKAGAAKSSAASASAAGAAVAKESQAAGTETKGAETKGAGEKGAEAEGAPVSPSAGGGVPAGGAGGEGTMGGAPRGTPSAGGPAGASGGGAATGRGTGKSEGTAGAGRADAAGGGGGKVEGAAVADKGAKAGGEASSGVRPAAAAGSTGAAGSPGRRAGAEREEIEVVYVIDKDTVAAEPVTTGASDDFYVEIKEGLSEGQMVVKGPYRVLRRLKEKDRVVTKDETEVVEEASRDNGSGSSNGRGD